MKARTPTWPIFRYIKRHNPAMLYANPQDVPPWFRPKDAWQQLFIDGCLVVLSPEVPAGKFWRVPLCHGRIVADAERRRMKFRVIETALQRMLSDEP